MTKDVGKTHEFYVPGKLMISGGYLVLDGEPAVMLSLNRKSKCMLELSGGPCAKIEIETSHGDRVIVGGPEPAEIEDTYFHKIIGCFREVVELGPSTDRGFRLRIDLDKHNFVEGQDVTLGSPNLVKTGLGTSGILMVSLVYALFVGSGTSPNKDLLLRTSLKINSSLAPGSSGADIFAAIYGSSVYFRSSPASKPFSLNDSGCRLLSANGQIVMGTFGRCTRSASAVSRDRSRLGGLRAINSEIVRAVTSAGGGHSDLASLCKKYLGELHSSMGPSVVPPKQLRVLYDTFEIGGVLAAGVAGAGGEDAFWALAEPDGVKAVLELWKSKGVLMAWTDTPDFEGLTLG